MLPARASGEIRKNGTAVVTTLSLSCPKVWGHINMIDRIRKRTIRKAVDFIVLF